MWSFAMVLQSSKCKLNKKNLEKNQDCKGQTSTDFLLKKLSFDSHNNMISLKIMPRISCNQGQGRVYCFTALTLVQPAKLACVHMVKTWKQHAQVLRCLPPLLSFCHISQPLNIWNIWHNFSSYFHKGIHYPLKYLNRFTSPIRRIFYKRHTSHT